MRPQGPLKGGASSSPEYTKRGQSGNGTIVKMMPWGVRNRSYQTSWSKEAPVGGTEGGGFRYPGVIFLLHLNNCISKSKHDRKKSMMSS